jgi:transposase-like protein
MADFQSKAARTDLASTLRNASQSSLMAATSLGKWPRVLTILRNCMFRLSMALVTRYIMPATNAIESINMSLRKVITTRSSFPTDEAVTKLFYLALNNISKNWSMPIRDWKAALNRFTIQFEERLVPG